jgi:serine/threonine protein phosphatase 1
VTSPRRLGIFGDVHGAASTLRSALGHAKDLADEVIFVGDYVNRGPDTKTVLELLIEARSYWGDRLTLLKGNHEDVLLRFLEGADQGELLRHAGLSTLHSYLGSNPVGEPFQAFRRAFPAEHLSLLKSLALYYETEDLLVSHVGFNPANPSSRSVDDMVLGSFPELFSGSVQMPKSLVICGHYVQRSGVAYGSANFVCLDSGCGSVEQGPLSLLTLPDRTIHIFKEPA